MALIGMAVYCTKENGKDEYLHKTLQSLRKTVNFTHNRLCLSINAKTAKTDVIIKDYEDIINTIIINDKNIGTAEAINLIWNQRLPDENCIKIDDDVVIHKDGWIDLMEEAIRRDKNIGQIGLKRRDCWESPTAEGFYKSELAMLPHEAGQIWITVEEVNHVMGTCVMHSHRLLDKVGYLWQPGVYGFDESFMSLRSRMAGFYNCFLLGVDIEHIDRGDTPFQQWKQDQASSQWELYHKARNEFTSGKRPIYYNPFVTG